ncbi:snake venom 5'-nucleotidase-like isoform X2 [Thrips palmi]|nr:snake venom 5'-nucleotidase-like isoform X2 [Thrips palmi]XP_034235171.1 snake venom 5'-nucleotidase-like isoform X2 [Thrips palmi]XP_034235172.1 snake venom 5'-nucleotidase-like isoform X2 [Thrips palmi]
MPRVLALLLCAAGCLQGCLALPAKVVQAPAEGLELTLLHVNDVHARYEQTNKLSGTCSDSDAKANNCYGGQARMATVIKQARKDDANVLVLNAGDTYQGTVYFSIFKADISAKFVNLLQFDAVTLGNHEFDDHVKGLVPFVEQVTVPLVVANLDYSQEPTLAALETSGKLKKSVVLERGGYKIGIIGYLTPETKFLASPDNVQFVDEVEAITKEAAELKKQGVNIIIGLGHSGYQRDQEIAKQVPDIDVVVGGHSHSFLYTGTPPDNDVPVGLYPTWITQDSGRRVPVVQAYAFTKYMGKLKLKFDAEGELQDLQGGPILLNKDVEEDPDTLTEVLKWKAELNDKVLQPIGRTAVLLDGSCRAHECNLGNLIADSFVYGAAEFQRPATGWTDAPIALVNGGSIRTSIDASTNNGQITLKDIMEVMPFDNLQVKLKLRGKVLMQALEHSVSEYVPGQAWKGAFLQFSGIRVTYDVSRPAGQRVVSAEVRCGACKIPAYSPLDPSELYGVIVNGFMGNGGDGFTMLADNEGSEQLQDTDEAVTQHYIERFKLVYPAVEGRITFVSADASTTPVPGTSAKPAPGTSPKPAPGTSPKPSPSSTAKPSSAARAATPVAALVVAVLVSLLFH